MPLASEDALNLVLALSRRVKTQAGAKLYNQPIGAVINPDDEQQKNSLAALPMPNPNATPVKDGEQVKHAPSLVRIRSLLNQMKHAIKMGDESQAKLLKRQLGEAITLYAEGKDIKTVMAKVEGLES